MVDFPYPIAKSLVAGRAVREPVGPPLGVDDGEAGRVQVAPAAPEMLHDISRVQISI